MQSKGNSPGANEIRWREAVREQGCVLGHFGPVEIHHVVGVTARHLKQDIGHWWILPVSNSAHREVERMPKTDQKEMFRQVCAEYLRTNYTLPFSAEVLLAIWDWHR